MLIRGNTLSNMQLLTEWEGRTVKYLARSHDVRIEHRAIKKAKYSSIWPKLTHSVNKYYYSIIMQNVDKILVNTQ